MIIAAEVNLVHVQIVPRNILLLPVLSFGKAAWLIRDGVSHMSRVLGHHTMGASGYTAPLWSAWEAVTGRSKR